MTCLAYRRPKEIVERFFAWAESEEGKRALAESDERQKELERLFASARDIDWRRLHEPFTI